METKEFIYRRPIKEGIFLLLLSLITIFEGLRVTIHRDPKAVQDVVGPGAFVLALGIALLPISVILLLKKEKGQTRKRKKVNREELIVYGMIAIMGIYIFLMDRLGYVLSSLVFFTLMLRVVNFRSLGVCLLVSSLMSAVFYLIFIYLGGLSFPSGTFW